MDGKKERIGCMVCGENKCKKFVSPCQDEIGGKE